MQGECTTGWCHSTLLEKNHEERSLGQSASKLATTTRRTCELSGYASPMQRVEHAIEAQRALKRHERQEQQTLEAKLGLEGAAHLRSIAAMRRGKTYHPRRLAATKHDLQDVLDLGNVVGDRSYMMRA
jgi:hypothetical protein